MYDTDTITWSPQGKLFQVRTLASGACGNREKFLG